MLSRGQMRHIGVWQIPEGILGLGRESKLSVTKCMSVHSLLVVEHRMKSIS